MKRMFIFGLGYTAGRLQAALQATGWRVLGTGSGGDVAFDDVQAVRAELEQADCVLSSVPPSSGEDAVLARYGTSIGRNRWTGYLSATGVYGDTAGAWVDETAPTIGRGGQGRRTDRAEADARWLALGARVFRLPGIYGPGRSALDRVIEGKARRIDLPNQVFSRVHVDDIVSGIVAALDTGAPAGTYNLSDDLPCSQNLVIEEACRLLRAVPPELQTIEQAQLSAQAREFYSENRRIANGKAKRVLGWVPRYPTYREGLASLR